MKYLYLILGLLFISFAAVQYNDPDPYIWGTYYTLVAVICFFQYKNRNIRLASLLSLAGTFLWALSYLPGVIEWFQQGRPNIASNMKAETPYIENMREFLGLIICFGVLLSIVLKNRNKKLSI